MHPFKKILAIVAGVLLLLLSAGLLFTYQLNSSSIPDYNEDVDLTGLSSPVTVTRDSLGIPHVYAQNETDLYMVVGYLMAQDRLWQMDLLRRVTTGRLSEVLDPGLAEVDLLFRALQLPDKSNRVLERTSPEMLACLKAFSDGINQFMEQHRKKLPVEFRILGYEPEPWTPQHTANMIGYMSWSLTSGWNTEISLFKLKHLVDSVRFAELVPDLDLHTTTVYPEGLAADTSLVLESALSEAAQFIRSKGLQVFGGSNNWAVSGSKSTTGMPILANDMHLGLMVPGIWYQMHHVVEGKLNVTGVVLPGSPYVICGHNEYIAWGMTNVTVDDLDFYLETIHPGDTNRYMLDGQWRQMELVEEHIRLKGKKEPLIRVNRYTHRGPVVGAFRGIDSLVVSARWQGREYSNELRTVHLLNRASDWDQFRDALRTFTSISQNVVYADRSGNIGLQCAAGIPIRKGSGIMVFPGDTSLYDWTGRVPFEELPNVYNPPSGHVSSANNRTAGPGYPYYVGTWFSLPSRIDRIRELLEEKELLGISDFQRMQGDQQSVLARELCPVYLEALADRAEGTYLEALTVLEQWDHTLDQDSPGALIFEVMWHRLHEAVFLDELGPDKLSLVYGSIGSNLLNRIKNTGHSAWCDDVTTPDRTELWEDNIRVAFHQTVDTLVHMFGNEPSSWKWGTLHQLLLKHPLGEVRILDRVFSLNRGPYPVGGSFHTVCPFSYARDTYIADHGASQRHVFNTADWDRSVTVIPTGTSGVPAARHFMDQTPLYMDHRYHTDPFSKSAVETHALYSNTFR